MNSCFIIISTTSPLICKGIYFKWNSNFFTEPNQIEELLASIGRTFAIECLTNQEQHQTMILTIGKSGDFLEEIFVVLIRGSLEQSRIPVREVVARA